VVVVCESALARSGQATRKQDPLPTFPRNLGWVRLCARGAVCRACESFVLFVTRRPVTKKNEANDVVNTIPKETGLRERRRKRRSYLEAFARWQSAVGTCVYDGAQASQPHFTCVERPALHVGSSLGGLRVLVVAGQLQLKEEQRTSRQIAYRRRR
jgi:hypothetical protein